jgi:hypothetical protein
MCLKKVNIIKALIFKSNNKYVKVVKLLWSNAKKNVNTNKNIKNEIIIKQFRWMGRIMNG